VKSLIVCITHHPFVQKQQRFGMDPDWNQKVDGKPFFNLQQMVKHTTPQHQ
jgi:hypothetical protein